MGPYTNRALGIYPLCNGHGDVTAVSTGPPPVMDLANKRPGLLGGPVERTAHRPRFGASPSLPYSSVTKKRTKCHEAFFSGLLKCHSAARVRETGVCGGALVVALSGSPRGGIRVALIGVNAQHNADGRRRCGHCARNSCTSGGFEISRPKIR